MIKAKAHLKDFEPYPPGKTEEEFRREYGIKGQIYKMNSNENPFGPPPKVVEKLPQFLKNLHKYPDPSYQDLKEKIANFWGLSPDFIILGNGSDEVIELLFKAFVEPGDEIVVSDPSFLMYEKYAGIYNVKVKKVPINFEKFTHHLEALKNAISEKTKVCFLDHPHNPTGTVISKEEWKSFLRGFPEDVLLVIDEAYADFISEKDTFKGKEFLDFGKNIFILRTFSKAFGLAGIRLGYGVGNPELVKVLDSIRSPFNVNFLALKAGKFALEDLEFYNYVIKTIQEERTYLSDKLRSFGFKVIPSQSNFIMVNFGKETEKIYNYLLKQGILTRWLKAYGLSEFIRISIGKPEENRYLVKSVEKFLSEKS